MTRRCRLRLAPGLILLPLWVGCQSVHTFDDPRSWGAAEEIETGQRGALGVQIAIDATGAAIAVWDQTPQETSPFLDSDDIWSNRTDAEGRWGTAARIEENEPAESFEPQIAASADGSVVVVFLQEDEEMHFSVWAVRHTPSGGWEPPVCIQSDDPECGGSDGVGNAGQAQVAVDPRGNAVAVWQQHDADDDPAAESLNIWSNRFTEGDGWGAAGPLDPDTNDLSVPQVAMDAEGNAIAVWERFDGTRTSIFSKRQTPAGEWVELQDVENDDNGNAFFPQVAVDPEGDAIAVWQQQTDGSRFDIWSNRYLASTRSWVGAERIDNEDADDAETPQIALDGDSNAIAVWVQSGGDLAGIWSSRYVADVGWGVAAPIGPTGLGSARTPQVASNPDGDAVAVWVQFDGVQDSIWSNRYRVGGGWGRSEPIEIQDEQPAQRPQVAMDLNGNAVAVWSQGVPGGAAESLWSSRLSTEGVAAGRGAAIPVPGLGTR